MAVANGEKMENNRNRETRLVTVGFRIPEQDQSEIERIANLLHVRQSEVIRWIFDVGWSQKERIVRAKAGALLSFLGERLPEKGESNDNESSK